MNDKERESTDLPNGLTPIGLFKDTTREFKEHFRRKLDAIRELAENARGVDDRYNASKFSASLEDHSLGVFLHTACDGEGIRPRKMKRILHLGHDEEDLPGGASLYSRQGKGLKAATYALGMASFIFSKHANGWSISVIGEALPGKMLSFCNMHINPAIFNSNVSEFKLETYLGCLVPKEARKFQDCLQLMVRKSIATADVYGVNSYSPFSNAEALVERFNRIPGNTGLYTMTLLHPDSSLCKQPFNLPDRRYDIVDRHVLEGGQPIRLSTYVSRWWLPIDQDIQPPQGNMAMKITSQDFEVDPACHPWSQARRAGLAKSGALRGTIRHEDREYAVAMQLTLVAKPTMTGFPELVNDESACGFILHQNDRALHYGSPVFPRRAEQAIAVSGSRAKNQKDCNSSTYERLAQLAGLKVSGASTSKNTKPRVAIPGIPWDAFNAVPQEGKARKYMMGGAGVLALIVLDNAFVNVVGLGDNKQSLNDHALTRQMYDWAYLQMAQWAWELPYEDLPLTKAEMPPAAVPNPAPGPSTPVTQKPPTKRRASIALNAPTPQGEEEDDFPLVKLRASIGLNPPASSEEDDDEDFRPPKRRASVALNPAASLGQERELSDEDDESPITERRAKRDRKQSTDPYTPHLQEAATRKPRKAPASWPGGKAKKRDHSVAKVKDSVASLQKFAAWILAESAKQQPGAKATAAQGGTDWKKKCHQAESDLRVIGGYEPLKPFQVFQG